MEAGMNRVMVRLVCLAIGVGAVALAQTVPSASGHWLGKILIPNRELAISVDLAQNSKGTWIGSMSVIGSSAVNVPLQNVSVEGTAVRFAAGLPDNASFDGHLSPDSTVLSGTAGNAAGEVPFSLTRSG